MNKYICECLVDPVTGKSFEIEIPQNTSIEEIKQSGRESGERFRLGLFPTEQEKIVMEELYESAESLRSSLTEEQKQAVRVLLEKQEPMQFRGSMNYVAFVKSIGEEDD